VIYAGFVATNGLGSQLRKREAEGGPLLPNKLHIVQPNNIQQTLALIIYIYHTTSNPKKTFCQFPFHSWLCLSCNNKSFARFGWMFGSKLLKKLI
jgi:hypothetical protein